VSGVSPWCRPPDPSLSLPSSLHLRTFGHVLELDVLGVLDGGVPDGGGAVEVVMGGHHFLGGGGGGGLWLCVCEEGGRGGREGS